MTEKKEFYCIKEVAQILGVHPRTIWRWVKIGKIESIKIGGVLRIHSDELLIKKIMRQAK